MSSRLIPGFGLPSLWLFSVKADLFACVSVCVCVHTCVCVCVCSGGVARVLKGGGGGGFSERCLSIGRPWSSLLYFKRLLSHLSYKRVRSSTATHSHHILAFCFNGKRGGKNKSRDIPEPCFVEVRYKLFISIE